MEKVTSTHEVWTEKCKSDLDDLGNFKSWSGHYHFLFAFSSVFCTIGPKICHIHAFIFVKANVENTLCALFCSFQRCSSHCIVLKD